MRRLLLLLVLLTPSALAQNVIQCIDQPNLACAKQAGAIGVLPANCGPSNVVGSIDVNGNIGCVAGGGGGGAALVAPLRLCTPIDGSVTIFGAPGACEDQSEAAVLTYFSSTTTFTHIGCAASGTVNQNVIITPRRQPGCSGAASDSTMACTITNGGVTCNNSGTLTITAGDCFAGKFTTGGILSPLVRVNCTLS